VTRCHPVAALLFDSIIEQLARRGVPVVTVDRQARGMVASSAEFATRVEAVADIRRG
jgi:ABC-type sugar transport system substrate-binding protein